MSAIPIYGSAAPYVSEFAARLWSRIIRPSDTQCWIWPGARIRGGYGSLQVSGPRRTLLAHRVAWSLSHGPIPAGVDVLHRCDNPPCVNPAHLFLGTDADNLADAYAKGRRRLGEQHPNAKLSATAVLEIRRLRAAGLSFDALGRRFGVSRETTRGLIRGETWQHVGQP